MYQDYGTFTLPGIEKLIEGSPRLVHHGLNMLSAGGSQRGFSVEVEVYRFRPDPQLAAGYDFQRV